jgi:hypothetical protein
LQKNAVVSAQVDPSHKLEKPGWWGLTAGHQDRNDRETAISCLSDKSEFALVLLSVANPVASNKDGNGIGAADCVFERWDPWKT